MRLHADEDRDDSTVASTPLQDFNIGDGSIVTTTTSCFLSKRGRLESVSSCHPFHRHLSLKDHTALAEVEVMIVDNTYPFFAILAIIFGISLFLPG